LPGDSVRGSEAPAVTAIQSAGARLALERSGAGTPIVLAHGLTATRRYVTHGSRILERSGFDVLAYDARGHGDSTPAADQSAYAYADLVADLEAVMDAAGLESAVLAGTSMGAATAIAFTLEHPERARALVQITPAHFGLPQRNQRELARWDALADGLESGGVDGFMRAYGEPPVGARFRGLVLKAIRRRIERHRHPAAVAQALRQVPRSVAWEGGLDELEHLGVPTLVVGSRDELDPEHALSIAVAYAERIPGADLVVEEPGASPLAWRGAQLSRAVVEYLERVGVTA
jgi:pimeloyl-ACP methyl ester carboxylesterase